MIIRIIALLLLTIGATVIHGRMTDRWGKSDDLEKSAAIVRSVPKQLGDWTFVRDEEELSRWVVDELGITDYIRRVYTNGEESVHLLLMSGETARLVRHTPDICYDSAGNTFIADPTPAGLTAGGTQHGFLVLPIQPQSDAMNEYVVVYGFATDGVFSSPTSPRLKFHGMKSIQKIQVLSEPDPVTPTAIPKAAADFISQLCRSISVPTPDEKP